MPVFVDEDAHRAAKTLDDLHGHERTEHAALVQQLCRVDPCSVCSTLFSVSRDFGEQCPRNRPGSTHIDVTRNWRVLYVRPRVLMVLHTEGWLAAPRWKTVVDAVTDDDAPICVRTDVVPDRPPSHS